MADKPIDMWLRFQIIPQMPQMEASQREGGREGYTYSTIFSDVTILPIF